MYIVIRIFTAAFMTYKRTDSYTTNIHFPFFRRNFSEYHTNQSYAHDIFQKQNAMMMALTLLANYYTFIALRVFNHK